MAATPAFDPPAADLPGKPYVRPWIPPPVTKETHNFAKLSSIKLSLMDSDDPAVVDSLVQQVKTAIREDGFLFLEDYGVSLEQVRFGSVRIPLFKADGCTLASSTVCNCSISLRQHYRRRQRSSPLPP